MNRRECVRPSILAGAAATAAASTGLVSAPCSAAAQTAAKRLKLWIRSGDHPNRRDGMVAGLKVDKERGPLCAKLYIPGSPTRLLGL